MIASKRSIDVLADSANLHVVESFVEKICDDYSIFRSYFGIILFSVAETFNVLLSISRNGGRNVAITINFKALSKGLYFQFYTGENTGKLSEVLSKTSQPGHEADEMVRNMQIVGLLSDHHHIDTDKGLFEIGFSIGSINNHLVKERQKVMDQYYEVMNQTRTV